MKRVLMTVCLLSISLFAQGSNSLNMFSSYELGIFSGLNFNSNLTLGGAFDIEIKSGITSNLNIKLSLGYSRLSDDNSFEIKNYSYFEDDDIKRYYTHHYRINDIEYDLFPISVGAEYILSNKKIAPFGIFEIGYCFCNYQKRNSNPIGTGAYFNTLEEVPEEFRRVQNLSENLSSFTMTAGIGLKYKMTRAIALAIKYIYRYNNSVINTNQILFGIIF